MTNKNVKIYDGEFVDIFAFTDSKGSDVYVFDNVLLTNGYEAIIIGCDMSYIIAKIPGCNDVYTYKRSYAEKELIKIVGGQNG